MQLLFQFVGAHSVALFRLVEDAQVKRVLLRAAVARPSSQPTDSPAADMSVPPTPLASMPLWQECLDRNATVQYPGPAARTMTLFPITRERDSDGILVIDADEALPARDVGNSCAASCASYETTCLSWIMGNLIR